MAQKATKKLRESGALPELNETGRWPFVFKEKMQRKLRKGLKKLKSCSGLRLQDLTYETPCKGAHYDLGAWAHAYLDHKFGSQALLGTFYPSLNELGWEGAFTKAYGITSEEFYTEFDQFLKLPLNQQMAILP